MDEANIAEYNCQQIRYHLGLTEIYLEGKLVDDKVEPIELSWEEVEEIFNSKLKSHSLFIWEGDYDEEYDVKVYTRF